MTRSETYNLSLDMTWEVDLFGRQLQNLAAATKDVQQTVENYYAAQVTLTGDVATAYITYRAAQAQLDVVRRNVETRRETTEITRWQQEAGVSDMLELQQAVSTLEQARASIPSIEQTISETKNQLAVLCGQTPGALDRLLDRPAAIPRVPPRLAVGIPAQTLNNRPDVRATVYGVLAAYHRKTAAELQRFPTINLDGSLGLEALRTGTIFSPRRQPARWRAACWPVWPSRSLREVLLRPTFISTRSSPSRPCTPTSPPCSRRFPRSRTRW